MKLGVGGGVGGGEGTNLKSEHWTGMDFATSTGVAENRTRWREIVWKIICSAPCKGMG